MANEHTLKLCLAASAGGHLTQLLKLAEGFTHYDLFSISTTEVIRQTLQSYGRVYVVGECNRDHPGKVLAVFTATAKIIFREKPDVVISTGAAAGCLACFLAKLVGARIIWIDSITNVKRLSLSGRMVRYIADLFLVQWPELTGKYNNVEYAGALI